MAVPTSSSWRIFSDLLIDVRMPVFAFIAGAVYAIRPISLKTIAKFLSGKFHRLVVPGIIASSSFWILGNTIFNNTFASNRPVLESVLLANGHFWFLQAILIIFIVFGIIDAYLKHQSALILLPIFILLNLAWGYFGFPRLSYVKIHQAAYLAPYFIFGVVLVRHAQDVKLADSKLLLVAIALFLLSLLQNINILSETGRLSTNRYDIQSLAFGFSAIFLLFRFMPSVPLLNRIGLFTFTIYLYHPLGTSATKRLSSMFDFNGGVSQFVVGIFLGMFIPILIHLACSHSPYLSRLTLGIKSKPAPSA